MIPLAQYTKAVCDYAKVKPSEALVWYRDLCDGNIQSVVYKLSFNPKWWRLDLRRKARRAILETIQPENMRSIRALEKLLLLHIQGIEWTGLDRPVVVPDYGSVERITILAMEGGFTPEYKDRIFKALSLLSMG